MINSVDFEPKESPLVWVRPDGQGHSQQKEIFPIINSQMNNIWTFVLVSISSDFMSKMHNICSISLTMSHCAGVDIIAPSLDINDDTSLLPLILYSTSTTVFSKTVVEKSSTAVGLLMRHSWPGSMPLTMSTQHMKNLCTALRDSKTCGEWSIYWLNAHPLKFKIIKMSSIPRQ